MPEATPKSIAQFYEDLLKAVDGISDEKDAIFLEARRHLEYTYQLAVKGDPKRKIAALEPAWLKSSCEACEAAMKEAGSAILESFPSRQDDDGKSIPELKKPAHLAFITLYQQYLKMLRDGEYDYRGVFAAIMAWDPTGYVDRKKKQGKVETEEAINKLQLAIDHYWSQQGIGSEASTELLLSNEVGSQGSRASSAASSSLLPPVDQSLDAGIEGGAASPASSAYDLPEYAIGKVNIADADTLKATYLMLLRAYWGYDKNRMGDFCNKKARIAAFFGAFLIHILPPCLVDKPIRFLATTRRDSYFFPRMREAVEVFDRKVQADAEAARVSESVLPADLDSHSETSSEREGANETSPVKRRPAFLPKALEDEDGWMSCDEGVELVEGQQLAPSPSS
jgi:hypothetical protein